MSPQPPASRPAAEDLALADAAFHDTLAEDYADRVQWSTPRNQLAHGLIHQAVLSFGPGLWAEVGCGLSLDGEALATQGVKVVAVDPSRNMLRQGMARLVGTGLPWTPLQAQGAALPFLDESLAGVLWVASLHHLPDHVHALRESARVVRPGGGVVVGMEPARWWHEPVERFMQKKRPQLAGEGSRFSAHGSPADEMGEGFTRADWSRLAVQSGLRLKQVQPLWLTLGFAHLGLEAGFRLLKTRQRWRLPAFVEKAMWRADSLLLRLPPFNLTPWHWLAVFEKPGM